jgi:hypothetical protein
MESAVEVQYVKRIITELIVSSLGLVTKNLRAVSFQLNNEDNIIIYFYLSQIDENESENIRDFLFEFEAYHGGPINIEKRIIELDKSSNHLDYMYSSQTFVLAKAH